MPAFDDFKPCKGVPERKRGSASAHAATIRSFLRSGVECARYECETPRQAKSYVSALRVASKGHPVTVPQRGRCVYLSRGARDGR